MEEQAWERDALPKHQQARAKGRERWLSTLSTRTDLNKQKLLSTKVVPVNTPTFQLLLLHGA